MRNSFFLCWNGFQYNITGAVSDFLKSQKYEVSTLANPLFPTDPNHRILANNEREVRVFRNRFTRVPFSYCLDPFFVLKGPKADVAITFSPHITWILLILKRIGKYKCVIQWNIDFSPRRFRNPLLNLLYNKLDYVGVKKSDLQIDLTEVAARARLERHNQLNSSSQIVVPVGIEREQIDPIPVDNFEKRKVFFLGNLTKFVGCDLFLESASLVLREFSNTTFHIIGDGVIKNDLTRLAKVLGIESKVIWHGNQDRLGIARLLKTASIGVAPYRNDENSFSRFADPSKIKNYLQFSMPIVTTSVTPISTKLFESRVAIECQDNPESLSKAISNLLRDKSLWLMTRKSAETFALSYCWDSILSNLESKILSTLQDKNGP